MSRDDLTLLRDHVAGDPEAFAELVSRHRDRLWAVALQTLRHAPDAEDALQEALIAAFRRAETFRGDAAVTSWLHRIVVNACLDRVRRNRVRAAEPLPGRDDLTPALGSAAGPDPGEGAVLALDVWDALGHITADQRAALVLVDMQGYGVDEAAVILGCAPGTVKSRCHRGRARLAVLLDHLGPVGGSA